MMNNIKSCVRFFRIPYALRLFQRGGSIADDFVLSGDRVWLGPVSGGTVVFRLEKCTAQSGFSGCSGNHLAAGIPGLADEWRHLPGDVSRCVDASYHACDFYRFEAFVPERGSPGGTEALPVNRRQLCVRSVPS